MNIEKIEHDDCVNVTLDTEEVKCLCEALYGAFYDNEDNPVFRKLYRTNHCKRYLFIWTFG